MSGDLPGITQALFGRPVRPATLARLAGAQPAARVQVFAQATPGVAVVLHDARADRYYATRIIERSRDDGALILHNHMLEVAQPGGGLGTRIFATQAKTAASLGIARIETTGARDDTRTPNPVTGYRAWIAMGYNAPTPNWFRPYLPPALRNAPTMLDVYRSSQGRAAWAQHGRPLKLTFDLAHNSRSWQTLRARLRAKGIDWNSL